MILGFSSKRGPYNQEVLESVVKMTKSIYIIAEAGVNHNGSIDMALELVDLAVASGADAVKFQTFEAEKLVSPKTSKVKYQKKFTKKNESHFQMIKSLELSKDNHKILFRYCKKKK